MRAKSLFVYLTVCVFALSKFAFGQSQELVSDFEILMGKNTKSWRFFSKDRYTDRRYYEFFKNHYDKNFVLKKRLAKHDIPQLVHFIWLGPREFPSTSVKNVESWIKKHPGYKVILWTDRPRLLPDERMELRVINPSMFTMLYDEFSQSHNYGEKSDLLRYEILYRYGGIYADHDVECITPFDDLVAYFDFFCGIEPLHKPIGDTSMTVCNNLIGVCKNHPIIAESIRLAKQNFYEARQAFPGSDTDSITRRLYFGTFSAFDKSVKQNLGNQEYSEMVFPAGIFNKIEGSFGLYAHHYYASTWFDSETKFERSVRKNQMKLLKKFNQQYVLLSMIVMVSILMNFLVLVRLKTLSKKG